MKLSCRFRWIVAGVALLVASSLQAVDDRPVAEPGQATSGSSAQTRPLSEVSPDAGVLAPQPDPAARSVSEANTPMTLQSGEIHPSPSILEETKSGGIHTEAQPQCAICIEGYANVSWLGDSGTFHLDRLTNHRASGTSGTLRLLTVLTPSLPIWGNNLVGYQQSAYDTLGTLAAGSYFYNINSGTTTFYNSSIPAGTYYIMLEAQEFQGGTTWAYDDYFVFPDQVFCNGSGCTTTPTTTCTPDSQTLCIDNNPGDKRFKIQISFSTVQGGGLSGYGHPLSTASLGISQGGIFWFFQSTNPEVLVKVLNECSMNGYFWFYASAGTNVGLNIGVTDTLTGRNKSYTNPDLHPAAPVQDNNAFTCP